MLFRSMPFHLRFALLDFFEATGELNQELVTSQFLEMLIPIFSKSKSMIDSIFLRMMSSYVSLLNGIVPVILVKSHQVKYNASTVYIRLAVVCLIIQDFGSDITRGPTANKQTVVFMFKSGEPQVDQFQFRY